MRFTRLFAFVARALATALAAPRAARAQDLGIEVGSDGARRQSRDARRQGDRPGEVHRQDAGGDGVLGDVVPELQGARADAARGREEVRRAGEVHRRRRLGERDTRSREGLRREAWPARRSVLRHKGNATSAYDVPATSFVVVSTRRARSSTRGSAANRISTRRSRRCCRRWPDGRLDAASRPSASPSRIARTSAVRGARVHHRHAKHAAAVEFVAVIHPSPDALYRSRIWRLRSSSSSLLRDPSPTYRKHRMLQSGSCSASKSRAPRFRRRRSGRARRSSRRAAPSPPRRIARARPTP